MNSIKIKSLILLVLVASANCSLLGSQKKNIKKQEPNLFTKALVMATIAATISGRAEGFISMSGQNTLPSITLGDRFASGKSIGAMAALQGIAALSGRASDEDLSHCTDGMGLVTVPVKHCSYGQKNCFRCEDSPWEERPISIPCLYGVSDCWERSGPTEILFYGQAKPKQDTLGAKIVSKNTCVPPLSSQLEAIGWPAMFSPPRDYNLDFRKNSAVSACTCNYVGCNCVSASAGPSSIVKIIIAQEDCKRATDGSHYDCSVTPFIKTTGKIKTTDGISRNYLKLIKMSHSMRDDECRQLQARHQKQFGKTSNKNDKKSMCMHQFYEYKK